MLSILGILAPIMILIAVGALLRTLDFPGKSFWPALEQLIYFVLYPALLFRSIAESELAALNAGSFALALLGALLLMTVVLAVLRRLAGWGGPRYTSIYQGSLRWNGFVALAVSEAFLGAEGLAMTAIGIAIMVPTLNVLSVYTLTRHAGTEPQELKHVLFLLSRNPLIIACCAGILISATPIQLPEIAMASLRLLGNAALTLGLLAIGASLEMRSPGNASGQLIAVAGFKLVLMPLFVGFGCYVLGVTGTTLTVAMICAGVPTATSSYILARQLGGDAEFMAQAVTICTVASALTLPVILYLTK